jgi:hypothetical protein
MKRFRHTLLCEALEDRYNPSRVWSGSSDHIDQELLRYFENGERSFLEVGSTNRVAVQVNAPDVGRVLPVLRNLGFVAGDTVPELHFTQGMLPISALPTVETMGERGKLFGVIALYPSKASVGSVTSEAVDTLHSALVNSKSVGGLTGANIKVGVIRPCGQKLVSAEVLGYCNKAMMAARWTMARKFRAVFS